MSALNVIAGGAGIANIVGSAAQFVLSTPAKRAIGTIVADITIEEKHDDQLSITEHPVETGSISDHAYKEPAVLQLRVGWSASSDSLFNFDNPTYIKDIYDKLLKLQASRQPFKIYTGKRVYENMLIKSLSTRTDKQNDNALPITMTCREVLVAQAVPTPVPTDQTLQSFPEDTTPAINNGAVQFQTAPYFDSGVLDQSPIPL